MKLFRALKRCHGGVTMYISLHTPISLPYLTMRRMMIIDMPLLTMRMMMSIHLSIAMKFLNQTSQEWILISTMTMLITTLLITIPISTIFPTSIPPTIHIYSNPQIMLNMNMKAQKMLTLNINTQKKMNPMIQKKKIGGT